jgi:hemerythrin superfamily protein
MEQEAQERAKRTSRRRTAGTKAGTFAPGGEERRKQPRVEDQGLVARIIRVATGQTEETETDAPDPIEMLKQGHEKVRSLFKQYEDSEGGVRRRKEIVDEISTELEIHAQIEEKIFYQAFREVSEKEPKKLVRESFEEHKIVKTLLAELAGMKPKDEQFDAKVTVLKEAVEHHAEEEEDDLFPAAKKLFDDRRLRELGAEMLDMKEELQEKLGAA